MEKRTPSPRRKRCRTAQPQNLSQRLRNVRTRPTEPLDALVADVLEDIKKFIGAQEIAEESSSSDESEPTTLEGRKRLRNLRRRAMSRARAFVASSLGLESGLRAREL